MNIIETLELLEKGEAQIGFVQGSIAVEADRYMLFVVPIAILILPLLSRSPMLLTLYNRRKITRQARLRRARLQQAAREAETGAAPPSNGAAEEQHELSVV